MLLPEAAADVYKPKRGYPHCRDQCDAGCETCFGYLSGAALKRLGFIFAAWDAVVAALSRTPFRLGDRVLVHREGSKPTAMVVVGPHPARAREAGSDLDPSRWRRQSSISIPRPSCRSRGTYLLDAAARGRLIFAIRCLCDLLSSLIRNSIIFPLREASGGASRAPPRQFQ